MGDRGRIMRSAPCSRCFDDQSQPPCSPSHAPGPTSDEHGSTRSLAKWRTREPESSRPTSARCRSMAASRSSSPAHAPSPSALARGPSVDAPNTDLTEGDALAIGGLLIERRAMTAMTFTTRPLDHRRPRRDGGGAGRDRRRRENGRDADEIAKRRHARRLSPRSSPPRRATSRSLIDVLVTQCPPRAPSHNVSFASTRRTTISEPEVSGTPRPRHDDERRSLEARSSTTRGRLAPQRRRTRSRRRSTTNSITSRRSPAADDEPRRATGRFIHERLDPSPSASTTRFEEAPTCRRILALDTESEERAQRVQLGKRNTTTRSQHRMPGRTRSHDPVAGRLVTFVHGQAAPGPTRTSSPTRASRRTAPPAQAAVLVHSTLFVVAQP